MEKRLTAQGIKVSAETIEKAREELGLNRPLLVQYFAWLSGVVRGNLGFSYKDGFPVADKLLRALKETVKLTSVSLIVSLFISVPLSLISYVKKGKIDSVRRAMATSVSYPL